MPRFPAYANTSFCSSEKEEKPSPTGSSAATLNPSFASWQLSSISPAPTSRIAAPGANRFRLGVSHCRPKRASCAKISSKRSRCGASRRTTWRTSSRSGSMLGSTANGNPCQDQAHGEDARRRDRLAEEIDTAHHDGHHGQPDVQRKGERQRIVLDDEHPRHRAGKGGYIGGQDVGIAEVRDQPAQRSVSWIRQAG